MKNHWVIAAFSLIFVFVLEGSASSAGSGKRSKFEKAMDRYLQCAIMEMGAARLGDLESSQQRGKSDLIDHAIGECSKEGYKAAKKLITKKAKDIPYKYRTRDVNIRGAAVPVVEGAARRFLDKYM